MGKFITLLTLAIATVAPPAKPTSMKELTFLTRDGCVNTPDMVNNLDDALKSLGLLTDYAYVDIGTLPRRDVGTGYPTPTLAEAFQSSAPHRAAGANSPCDR